MDESKLNSGTRTDSPVELYYDSDNPATWEPSAAKNLDQTSRFQGLHDDIPHFCEIAASAGYNILDICCGSGRVAIPLARSGHHVTGVDISPGLLSRFKTRCLREGPATANRIELAEQDVSALTLPDHAFSMAFLAYNSFVCIGDFDLQRRTLQRACQHLAVDGLLVIDISNPWVMNARGDAGPYPDLYRINQETGRPYMRFSMRSAFDTDQRQRLNGWYDEMLYDGTVQRKPYEFYWRPVYLFELQLMLECAGFVIQSVEGGQQKETFGPFSNRIFVIAARVN